MGAFMSDEATQVAPTDHNVVVSEPVATTTAESGDTTVQNNADQATAADPEGEKQEEVTPEQAAKREGRRFERKLSNALRREAEARARAESYERELTQLRQAHQQVIQDPGAPKIEQFDDIEKFREAVEKHAYERGLKESETKRQSEAQQRAQKALNAAWEKRVDAASTKYEDFDEKVGDLKPTEPWSLAVMEADNGEDIAYYLGNHLDEARAIASLSPSAQIRAIGRLEAKLAAEPPKQKTPSKAPAPIKPVGGKSGGSSDMPSDNDDTATWIRKENARLRKMAVG